RSSGERATTATVLSLTTMRSSATPASSSSSFTFSASPRRSKMPVTLRLRIAAAASRESAAVALLHFGRLVVRADAQALLIFLLLLGLATCVRPAARPARALAGPRLGIWHGAPPKWISSKGARPVPWIVADLKRLFRRNLFHDEIDRL